MGSHSLSLSLSFPQTGEGGNWGAGGVSQPLFSLLAVKEWGDGLTLLISLSKREEMGSHSPISLSFHQAGEGGEGVRATPLSLSLIKRVEMGSHSLSLSL